MKLRNLFVGATIVYLFACFVIFLFGIGLFFQPYYRITKKTTVFSLDGEDIEAQSWEHTDLELKYVTRSTRYETGDMARTSVYYFDSYHIPHLYKITNIHLAFFFVTWIFLLPVVFTTLQFMEEGSMVSVWWLLGTSLVLTIMYLVPVLMILKVPKANAKDFKMEYECFHDNQYYHYCSSIQGHVSNFQVTPEKIVEITWGIELGWYFTLLGLLVQAIYAILLIVIASFNIIHDCMQKRQRKTSRPSIQMVEPNYIVNLSKDTPTPTSPSNIFNISRSDQ
ncbi:hypothetical protein DFA_10449 [Cavenderia fasciculata]|uniref:Transmembrane protein n=1 Tax=Cavenderia fasciculata TaxID=261658 RepID=F4QA88_CACFS|nr:uncharacterized protein DFA_10449 [Cavenderia fasciculata]EGG15607.1 hypothetical protein DFA_10449 [Cavenderia fasciculata]|eukprot:XP_004354349.1 hypothetical protein DFA_10449 [Cavenderia fasciculata]